MNEALFIRKNNEEDNDVLSEIRKIQRAQDEISKINATLESRVGNIEFQKDGEKCKAVLVIDEELLNECCEEISKEMYLIKEAYGRLLEMGVFEKKNREFNPGPNFNRPECLQSLQ